VRYGRLDRRVTLERKTVTHSASGAPIETWSSLATRSASVNPVSGSERFTDPQIVARDQTEFQMRWSPGIADLSPVDRITYGGNVWDILAVSEIGRREGLKIIAQRRADT
jgi:head-tail adaptor